MWSQPIRTKNDNPMTIDVLFQFNLFLVSKKMLGFFFLVLQLQPSLIFRSTQKKTTFCYVIYTYPRTLIFVSNTDTTISVSNVTCDITNFTALSNSSISPKT